MSFESLCCCEWFVSDKTEQKEYLPESEPGTPLVDMPKFHHVPVEQLFQIPQDWRGSTSRPHIPHRCTSAPVITSLKSFEYPKEKQYNITSEYSDVRVPRLPLMAEVSEKSVSSLQFCLCYDIQRQTLTVHLQNASNLPAKYQSGTSDPFVVMHLFPNRDEMYESKVVYKTLDPIFDQSFEFHQLHLDDLQQQKLIFYIYNRERSSKNFIGGVILPLSEDVDIFGVVYRMKIDDRKEKFNLVRHEYNTINKTVFSVNYLLLQMLDYARHSLFTKFPSTVQLYFGNSVL